MRQCKLVMKHFKKTSRHMYSCWKRDAKSVLRDCMNSGLTYSYEDSLNRRFSTVLGPKRNHGNLEMIEVQSSNEMFASVQLMHVSQYPLLVPLTKRYTVQFKQISHCAQKEKRTKRNEVLSLAQMNDFSAM